ncbi:MAG: flippase-like domain-containing protein [Anaerolineae bacterium]|nr:flippase-like domain-containing protein [Anaerolineae bacterium]
MKKYWKMVFWLLALALVGYTLSITPMADVRATLGSLRLRQIAVLALINAAIIALFAIRWWILLRTQGYRIPLWIAIRYRLAAFGVSYFTPGPQFGGEPLQVYFLHKNHAISTTDAVASLSLDKILELLANFTFLAFGIVMIAAGGFFDLRENRLLAIMVFMLAALPWLYLIGLYAKTKPLSKFARGVARIFPKSIRIAAGVKHSETQMSAFCRQNPAQIMGLMLLSGGIWIALVYEYGLMLHFLGAQLNLWQTLVFITAARLAFLAPLPGGLGSLEVSQVLAAQSLGLSTGLGVSIGLLIRLRDISFGLLGLLWGGIFAQRLPGNK